MTRFFVVRNCDWIWQDLIKYTEPDDEVYEDLQKAMASIKAVCKDMNDKQKLAENQETMRSYATKIYGKLDPSNGAPQVQKYDIWQLLQEHVQLYTRPHAHGYMHARVYLVPSPPPFPSPALT